MVATVVQFSPIHREYFMMIIYEIQYRNAAKQNGWSWANVSNVLMLNKSINKISFKSFPNKFNNFFGNPAFGVFVYF